MMISQDYKELQGLREVLKFEEDERDRKTRRVRKDDDYEISAPYEEHLITKEVRPSNSQ